MLFVKSLSRNTHIILASLIVAINVWVYFPAFFDTARGVDHHIYLSEIAHLDTLGDMLAESYSYTRSREFMTGDKVLFRPLVYISLVFEKWFFGYDFFWWQITGFILHLIAQWCFWRLLNVFSFSRLSFFVVLLSSVLFLQQEMVMRSHFHGYLLFQIFALSAIYEFILYCKEPEKKSWNFFKSLILLTIASFAFEGALLINGLFLILIFFPWPAAFAKFPVRHKLMTGLPMLTYLSVSAVDFIFRVKDFSYAKEGLTGSVHAGSFHLGSLVSNFSYVLQMGFQAFLFPAYTKTKFIAYQYSYGHFKWSLNHIPEMANAAVAFAVVIFLLTCIYLWVKNSKKVTLFWDLKVFIFSFLMLTFVVGYITLICLMRLNDDQGYLRTQCHHYYTIYSFAMVGFYYLAQPILRFLSRYRPGIIAILISTILLLSTLQGYYLYRLNDGFRSLWEKQRIFLLEIDRFARKHHNEPDFSFTLFKTELVYMNIIENDQNARQQKYLVELLFPNDYQNDNPKYYLVYSKSHGLQYYLSPAKATEAFNQIAQTGWNPEFYLGASKIDIRFIMMKLKHPELEF